MELKTKSVPLTICIHAETSDMVAHQNYKIDYLLSLKGTRHESSDSFKELR